MNTHKRYPQELKERAVRMVFEHSPEPAHDLPLRLVQKPFVRNRHFIFDTITPTLHCPLRKQHLILD